MAVNVVGAHNVLADTLVSCDDATLVSAIGLANAQDGGTLDLTPGCTYTLIQPDTADNPDAPYGSDALPPITTGITIHGNGATIARSTAMGTPVFRFFEVRDPGSLSLDDVTVANGSTDTFGGGAILNLGGAVSIARSRLHDNSTTAFDVGGGAILSTLSTTDTNGTLALTGSTLSANSAAGMGGAVLTNGFASVTASLLSGNSAVAGGAIESPGTQLTVRQSIIADNSVTGEGGGIENAGGLTLTQDFLVGNAANDRGGAVFNRYQGPPVSAVIADTTFSGNSAYLGGGIANFTNTSTTAATVSVTDGTFVGNTATGGGAIANDIGTALTLTAATFSANAASAGNGGAVANAGALTAAQTIIANSPGGNCGSAASGWTGQLTDGGYNLEWPADAASNTCGFSSNAIYGDPALGPLQDNGGPTQTAAPAYGGAAVNAIPATACTMGSDQRGVPRPEPAAGTCDVGAVELAPTVMRVTSSATGAAELGQPVTFTATVASAVTAVPLPVPTGTVMFAVNSSDLCSPVPLDSTGTATCVATLSVGGYAVSATFVPTPGNGYLPSAGTIAQQVDYGWIPLYDETQPRNPGSTVPIKLELVDASGNDTSAASITVLAECLVPQGTSTCAHATLLDRPFTYSVLPDTGPGYQYNLTTKGLRSGQYDLLFTVAADPEIHAAPFVIG